MKPDHMKRVRDAGDLPSALENAEAALSDAKHFVVVAVDENDQLTSIFFWPTEGLPLLHDQLTKQIGGILENVMSGEADKDPAERTDVH